MKDIVKHLEENNELVTLEDGFVYYWPRLKGGLSAAHLRAIADELDQRNAVWQQDINEYFEKEYDDGKFKCPIDLYGCKEHCGNYGCGG